MSEKKKFVKFLRFLVLLCFTSLIFAVPSFATDTSGCPSPQVPETIGSSDVCVCPFTGSVPTGLSPEAEGSCTDSALSLPTSGNTCGSDRQLSGEDDLICNYINPIIDLLSGIVGVVVVLGIIIGGVQYSSSAGDPQKAARAKGRIINALIALIAYAVLWGFLQFIIPGGIFNGTG